MLQRDRSEDSALPLDGDAFFGFDRWLDAVRPAAVVRDPAGPFVHDLDVAVPHDVVAVAAEQRLGVKGDVHRAEQQVIRLFVEARVDERAGLPETRFGQHDGATVLIGRVIDTRSQPPHDGGKRHGVDVRRWRVTRDHQRNARFIDEDEVGFVHDRELVAAMNDLRRTLGGVIAQEIEAGFFGGHVRDVARVGAPPGVPRESFDDERRLEMEGAIERRHPLRVPACEVVVGGEDMHSATLERTEQGGKRGDQRLAFAGDELHEPAAVHRHGRRHLHVEGPHAEYVGRDLARHREHLGQQRIDTFTVTSSLPEHPCVRSQLILAAVTRSERVDRPHDVVVRMHVGTQQERR